MGILPQTALFALFLLTAHGLLARILRERFSNQMTALIAIGASCLACFGADLVFLSRSDIGRFVHASLCELCAGYSYFHFFNMSETSRRIKLMRMMTGIGRESAAKADYDLDDILKVRLARLAAMKQIRLEGNRYVLAGRTLYRACTILDGLKKVLALDAPRS